MLGLCVPELFAMLAMNGQTDRQAGRWTKPMLIAPFPVVGGITMLTFSIVTQQNTAVYSDAKIDCITQTDLVKIQKRKGNKVQGS